jgi:hypothetical protein
MLSKVRSFWRPSVSSDLFTRGDWSRICSSSAVLTAFFAVYVVGSSLSSFLEQSWKEAVF